MRPSGSSKSEFSRKAIWVPIFFLLGIFSILLLVTKVDSESTVVTEKIPVPENSTQSPPSSLQGLEEKIDNLSFNVKHTEEVLIQWKKNFRMIDKRFSALERTVEELVKMSDSDTTMKPHKS